MAIELVVFDLAGTTVNDQNGVNRCLRGALAEVGVSVTTQQVNQVMGIPKPEALRLLIEQATLHDPLLDRIGAIHDDFVARMIRFYESDPSVFEVPGASETFALLKQAGIKVALDTGFSRAIVRVLMERLGWVRHDLIDASVTSDEVPRGRPHPDMVLHLMARLGIDDPGRVVKVGDTPADLHEGANAGCGWIIGVTQGTHARWQLEQHPHTHLIDSVTVLPLVLGI
jgi:phosphonatase-like hydrolase